VGGLSPNPPVGLQGDTDPMAFQLPRTPVKNSAIDVADELVPDASHSQKDLSPRRIVLTRPKRVAPMLKTVQSSPIDAFSPVASSTPAKPPPGKVVDESPLLGKRRHDEVDASPTRDTESKGKAGDLASEHTSPIESPRFNTSTPGRTSKRPRESGGSPSPPPKKKALRTGVLPTSPINSAVFPPNTKAPPILNRQGSVTVSSGQLYRKPRDDKVITINPKIPPPAEVSVIESFDTSPPKPLTAAKRAGSVEREKKPQGVPVRAAVAETSFVTSPGTSPDKESTFLPPKAVRNTQAKNLVADSAATNLTSSGDSREGTDVAQLPNPQLPGRTAKTIGITKLRPAATTIVPTEAGPSKNTRTIPLRSRSTLGQAQKKNPVIPTKKGKEKPARMTPVEYAEMLIERFNNPNRRLPNVSQHLRGRKIFYVGVDMQYAGDATKKKMEYVKTFNAKKT
jgi:hypothetical protein